MVAIDKAWKHPFMERRELTLSRWVKRDILDFAIKAMRKHSPADISFLKESGEPREPSCFKLVVYGEDSLPHANYLALILIQVCGRNRHNPQGLIVHLLECMPDFAVLDTTFRLHGDTGLGPFLDAGLTSARLKGLTDG